MTITLTHDLEELINERVRSGAYESPEDVIKASLLLLEKREEGLDALRKEILLGVTDIKAGRFTTCDTDEEIESYSNEILERAQER